MATVYDYIESNNRRAFWLAAVFVVLVLVVSWWLAYGFGLVHYSRPPDDSESYVTYYSKAAAKGIVEWMAPSGNDLSEELALLDPSVYKEARWFAWRAAGVVLIFMLLLVFAPFIRMETMVLNSSHALRLQEADCRDLYRTATTVFKTAGLPAPRIYVISDDSLNAFTTGFSAQSACLVLTQGALDKLTRPELEAVIAHEAAHVLCGDTKLMLTAVSSVLLFSFLSELFFVGVFYGARKNVFSGIMMWVLGAASAVVGCVLAPLGRMAVSRTCEARADALGARICRNPAALAVALKKIAADSLVELLDNHPSMVGMCIVNPRKESNWFLEVTGLWNTHPPVEDRIRALTEMDGRLPEY